MNTQKVQFNLSQTALDSLDHLKEEIGASSRAELVRSAINLAQWIVNEMKEGNTICIEIKGGEIQKVVLPFITLSRVKNSTEKQ
ncbi:MAG: hypothetical protein Q8Q94_02040 [bacterium]|nr:hypothetical protein [bacterium]